VGVLLLANWPYTLLVMAPHKALAATAVQAASSALTKLWKPFLAGTDCIAVSLIKVRNFTNFEVSH
jgi:hypothetical protein